MVNIFSLFCKTFVDGADSALQFHTQEKFGKIEDQIKLTWSITAMKLALTSNHQ